MWSLQLLDITVGRFVREISTAHLIQSLNRRNSVDTNNEMGNEIVNRRTRQSNALKATLSKTDVLIEKKVAYSGSFYRMLALLNHI